METCQLLLCSSTLKRATLTEAQWCLLCFLTHRKPKFPDRRQTLVSAAERGPFLPPSASAPSHQNQLLPRWSTSPPCRTWRARSALPVALLPRCPAASGASRHWSRCWWEGRSCAGGRTGEMQLCVIEMEREKARLTSETKPVHRSHLQVVLVFAWSFVNEPLYCWLRAQVQPNYGKKQSSHIRFQNIEIRKKRSNRFCPFRKKKRHLKGEFQNFSAERNFLNIEVLKL